MWGKTSSTPPPFPATNAKTGRRTCDFQPWRSLGTLAAGHLTCTTACIILSLLLYSATSNPDNPNSQSPTLIHLCFRRSQHVVQHLVNIGRENGDVPLTI